MRESPCLPKFLDLKAQIKEEEEPLAVRERSDTLSDESGPCLVDIGM